MSTIKSFRSNWVRFLT